MKTMIKDLHKNDRFSFNQNIYLVKRKYISNDKPLIAYDETNHQEDRFYFDELEITKL
jgi:hypothetical protein